MDDHIALSVGRVILAFGQFDQELWKSIEMLEFVEAAKAVTPAIDNFPYEADIDKRFEHRLRHIRRLCVSLSGANTAILSRMDRMLTDVRVLERIRHHLAHGSVYESEGRMQVSDVRELREFNGKLRDAVLMPDVDIHANVDALRKRHLDISYSSEDLDRTVQKLRDLTWDLRTLAIELTR